jgi:hypothetical protein
VSKELTFGFSLIVERPATLRVSCITNSHHISLSIAPPFLSRQNQRMSQDSIPMKLDKQTTLSAKENTHGDEMSVSSKLKGPQDYRPPMSHRPVPGSLPLTFHVTLILETAVRRLLQYRCLTIMVLLVGIGDMVAGSSARAQTQQGPLLNVLSLPVSRETETNPKAKTNFTQDRCRLGS